MEEVLITANSPGEIAGWSYPVIYKLREKIPGIKISILLLPCSFSSGREKEVAEKMEGVHRVFTVQETLSLIFLGKKHDFNTKSSVLIHLGGDLFYSALLVKRLKIPLWSYEWANKMWDKYFTGYFAKDEKNKKELLRRGISEEKIHIVGDLLVDSTFIKANKSDIKRKSNLTISLMPGSREREAKGLLPLLGGVADLITEKYPDAFFYLPLSPFIPDSVFDSLFPLRPDEKVGGSTLTKEGNIVYTDKGTPVQTLRDSLGAMKNSDFIITIPGTTTGEAGILGIPFLSILPLNRPELIPYIGIIGLLEHIPFIGKPLKAQLMMPLSVKKPLLAQPNLRAGREVSPELMAVVHPENVFEKLLPYLEDGEKRKKISRDLKNIYIHHDRSSDRICEKIIV